MALSIEFRWRAATSGETGLIRSSRTVDDNGLVTTWSDGVPQVLEYREITVPGSPWLPVPFL